MQIAMRIGEEISRPIRFGHHEHAVSMSIGIRIDDDESTAETLVSDADAAMYYVKKHGANGYALYDPSQRPDAAGLDRIEREIRRALADDSVEVFYQPIVNPNTNRVHGVEALVRIRDRDGAYLNASHVIDVAERTGLITALDERVLALACAQATAWRATAEHRDLTLNINRSVKDITKPGFYERIMQALADSGLEPTALTIEITETVLLDATESNLADLRALGIARHRPGDRRLRYRVRLAALPGRAADHLHQARPLVHPATARRPDRDDPGRRDHRPRRTARHQVHGRGRRDDPAARRPADLPRHPDPGLSVRPAAEHRRSAAGPHLRERPDAAGGAGRRIAGVLGLTLAAPA